MATRRYKTAGKSPASPDLSTSAAGGASQDDQTTRRHLQEAVEAGNLNSAKEILTRTDKDFVNNLDKNGSTVLFAACWYGHLELVKLLIENDASINLTNFRKNRPICMAIEQNYIEVVKFLLAKGAKCAEDEVAEIRKRTGKKISKRMEKCFPKVDNDGPTLKELQLGLKNFSKNADVWDDFFNTRRASKNGKEEGQLWQALEDRNHYLHELRRTPLKERSLYAQNLKKQISEHPDNLYRNHDTSSKNTRDSNNDWATSPDVQNLLIRLDNVISPRKAKTAKTLYNLQRRIHIARGFRQETGKKSTPQLARIFKKM